MRVLDASELTTKKVSPKQHHFSTFAPKIGHLKSMLQNACNGLITFNIQAGEDGWLEYSTGRIHQVQQAVPKMSYHFNYFQD